MIIIRIGNYEFPEVYIAEHGQEAAGFWRADVRRSLWQTIADTQVPGLEDRESVIFDFGNPWECYDGEVGNPRVAFIIIEGLEDHADLPIELRRQLAYALGVALLESLPDQWMVQVFPKRYKFLHEGAILVHANEVASRQSEAVPTVSGPDAAKFATPPLRYRFRVCIDQGGLNSLEVFTVPYMFADWQELLKVVIHFGGLQFHLFNCASDLSEADVHPALRDVFENYKPGYDYSILEAIRMD